MTRVTRVAGDWPKLQQIDHRSYICGFCGNQVASNMGYGSGKPMPAPAHQGRIHICPFCNRPTFFCDLEQHPGIAPGNPVDNVPDDLAALYEEARQSAAAGAFTAAVLACRKMLMNIAVEEGADEGLRFIEYVQYLSDHNYVPPGGRDWVDYIRRRGNEANHEIALMQEEDAIALLRFIEMLLRFIYEFPSLIPGTGP